MDVAHPCLCTGEMDMFVLRCGGGRPSPWEEGAVVETAAFSSLQRAHRSGRRAVHALLS